MNDGHLPDEMRRIRVLLREQPLWMNIKEIFRAVRMSRNSVVKYLDVLTASGYLEGDLRVFRTSDSLYDSLARAEVISLVAIGAVCP